MPGITSRALVFMLDIAFFAALFVKLLCFVNSSELGPKCIFSIIVLISYFMSRFTKVNIPTGIVIAITTNAGMIVMIKSMVIIISV